MAAKSGQKGQWKRGQTGNPSGRPKKGYSIRECMRELMGETVMLPGKNGEPDKEVSKRELLSMKLFQIAASGDVGAIKLYIEQMDGAAKQVVETSGVDGAPIENQLTVKFVGKVPK